MKQGQRGGCSHRERLEVTATALIPAALGLLAPAVMLAGRLSWLGPVLALPVGLWVCLLWRELGERGLPGELERAFGLGFGWLAQLLYFLWGLALLCGSAQGFSRRLGRLLPGTEWFFLLTAAGFCLWLGRRLGKALAGWGRWALPASGWMLVALGLWQLM